MNPEEEPLYPISLYIYDRRGYHPGAIEIVSYEQLMGPGTRLLVRSAVDSGLEVRMTDPEDRLIFHARDGRVVWPDDQARETG